MCKVVFCASPYFSSPRAFSYSITYIIMVGFMSVCVTIVNKRVAECAGAALPLKKVILTLVLLPRAGFMLSNISGSAEEFFSFSRGFLRLSEFRTT